MALASIDQFVFEAAASGARPDPQITVSEWADENRYLTSRSASEAGLWRTSRTPYLREIMDSLSAQARYERVVLMKASQIGCTEAGNNWIGYIIATMPGPIMVVQPTGELARRNSRQRLDPLISHCPTLKRLVADPKSRDSANTIFSKEFPGGILMMAGANSSAPLRSAPARYLFLDEVDAYPDDVNNEGDPCELAIARTRTFPRRKIFIGSSPTIEGRSRIQKYFNQSDQRYYWMPCFFCHDMIRFEFSQLRWPKSRPEAAFLECPLCRQALLDHHKNWMLPRGEWRPSATGDPKTAGFHISSLYSPVGWFSWSQIAQKYHEDHSDRAKLQVFYNTILGVPFTEEVEQPDPQRLYERREPYRIGKVPRGGLLLTAGVDVQANRLEVEIVAWGRRRESWSVDYRVYEGNTTQQAVWDKITHLFNEKIPTEYGIPLEIARIAVDTGFNTNIVYDWAHNQATHRLLLIKGDSRSANLVSFPSPVEIGPHGKRRKYGLRVWPVNTGMAKEELYRHLHLPAANKEQTDEFPAGYCHFPQYSLEYFEQLTAEQRVSKYRNGVRLVQWQQVRHRNEALDCRVYARAAAASMRMELWSAARWDTIEQELELKPNVPPVEKQKPKVKFEPWGMDDPYL